MFKHIQDNAETIAREVYGLNIFEEAGRAEWREIIGVFRREIITNQYIKIDDLSNIAG